MLGIFPLLSCLLLSLYLYNMEVTNLTYSLVVRIVTGKQFWKRIINKNHSSKSLSRNITNSLLVIENDQLDFPICSGIMNPSSPRSGCFPLSLQEPKFYPMKDKINMVIWEALINFIYSSSVMLVYDRK